MQLEQKRFMIARTRDLATQFIQAADFYTSLASRFAYGGFAAELSNGDGENDPGDFINEDSGLTVEDMMAFYQTMGELLAPLTPDQKKAIHRMAR